MSVLIAQTEEEMTNLMHVVALKQRMDAASNPAGMLENIMRDSGYGTEANEILAVNSVGIYTRGNPHPGTVLIINFQFIDDDREETDGNYYVRFDAAGKMIGDF
jgi:hypothetical protein